MGDPVPPVPVKLFTGVLSTCLDRLAAARRMLESEFGPLDYVSPVFDFDLTNYYEPEMGSGIQRIFWSFQDLVDPGILPRVKLFTNQVEQDLAADGQRRVNLDPGYLDFHKVILASVKERAQKIYLSEGIYADPTLFYLKGRFHHYDWSLPDFKLDLYHDVFHTIRRLYREQIRELS